MHFPMSRPEFAAQRTFSLALRHAGCLVLAAFFAFAPVLHPGLSQASPGDLDPSFGTAGTVTTLVGNASAAHAMILQEDGKIVVVGEYVRVSPEENGLFAARYTTAGVLDPTFGTGGIVTTHLGDYGTGYAVTLQDDGMIVAAGYCNIGSDQYFVLVRYTTAGVLDAAFGAGGIVKTAVASDPVAHAVAIQEDGKIVIAGYSYGAATGTNVTMARYTSAGVLDASFGVGGIVVTPISDEGDYAHTVLIQDDGKIMIGGGGKTPDEEFFFAVLRYNADGTLDTSFASDGVAAKTMSTYSAEGAAMRVQADGSFVVAGYADVDDVGCFAMTRFTAAGELDATFGTGGVVTTPIGEWASANALAIQADGRIVLAGTATVDSDDRFALARYTSNGILDPSFGTAGTLTTAIGDTSTANALAIQADGKAVTAGGSDSVAALARYLTAHSTATPPAPTMLLLLQE